MFMDLLGKERYKVNLHTHTTLTDGQRTPEEVAAIYKANGYDAIALTDHWVWRNGGELAGLTIIPGCEYNVGGGDGADPVFHIVAIGCLREPDIPREVQNIAPGEKSYAAAARVIAAIREVGGLANLAHPAWSLNSPEMMMSIPGGFDVTEVYNSVSDFGMSDRANSELIIDQLGTAGVVVPLLATDDAHYYTGDECRGFIALDAGAVREMGMVGAIRAGRFYSSMGPEVHVTRKGREIDVVCSPAAKIEFMSNMVWKNQRIRRGEGLTEATYTADTDERFVRVVVVDAEGNRAWSNIEVL